MGHKSRKKRLKRAGYELVHREIVVGTYAVKKNGRDLTKKILGTVKKWEQTSRISDDKIDQGLPSRIAYAESFFNPQSPTPKRGFRPHASPPSTRHKPLGGWKPC